jgi:hypothetical protein
MRKFFLAASFAALAACTQQADKAAEADAPAAEVAAPAATDDSAPPTGDYAIKNADGSMATTRLNADGTFESTAADGTKVTGKYVRKDGKDCFDDDGDQAEVCWTAAEPAADGTFTSTSSTGETVTVTPPKS